MNVQEPVINLPLLFVTGTGTGVGKTVASAWLCRHFGASYWKAIQTGAADGDNDTAVLSALGVTTLPPARIFAHSSAPEYAASQEGTRVEVAEILSALPFQRPLVIEGAGGVLVPLNERETMLDLMAGLAARERLSVVVVAHTGLGTINHTLLTLAALRGRGLEVAGVVMSGAAVPHNREAVARHGGVRVLGELPLFSSVIPEALDAIKPSLTSPI